MFRKRVLTLFTLLLSIPAWAGEAKDSSYGDEAMLNAIHVEGYVRALIPGQKNTAAFGTIRNGSSKAIVLEKVESGLANIVEIHGHELEDGRMRMREIGAQTIPAGEQLAFEPGGKHIMMMDIQQALKPGDKANFRFCFVDACLAVTLPVISIHDVKSHAHHSH